MKGYLGHVGLGVKDISRSLRFYQGLLGMELLMELDINDDRIARVIGTPEAKCKIAHLKMGDGVLELFEYYNPVGRNYARDIKQYDQGLIHIGFEIEDFHKCVSELKEQNVEFIGEPVEFRKDVWVAYFKGPDGEACEIRERPKGKV